MASTSSSSLESQLLNFLAACPDGASVDEMAANVPGVPSLGQLVPIINTMLTNRLIILLRASGGQLRYKPASAREQKTKGLSPEEVLVFQQIQRAGNSGVWTKDLKIRTNLAQPQITKILKALEARGLMKSIKSVANPSRKLVMLAELEPSKEVTGGAWYTDAQQFDTEFISIVREALLRHIDRCGQVTLNAVTAWITSSGLVKNVDLGRDDVQQVLDSLAYEGKIEEVPSLAQGDDPAYRKNVVKLPDTTALTSVPCGRCPVIDDCREGGPISPQTCEYFARWLDF